MSPRIDSRRVAVDPVAAGAFRIRSLLILWPAFVAAGVLDALVFVVVDPLSLNWFGAEPMQWSSQAVYSITFLIFWFAIATSAATTLLLLDLHAPADGEGPRRSR
jgi:hypothetical protein